VYIPPNESQTAKEVLRSLSWIVNRLFYLEKKPNIIIAGDFNKIAMKDVTFLETLGLFRVVEDGIQTHSKGGTLDGIWTNLRVTSCVLTDGLPDITDHSLVQVNLLMDKEVSRILPHKVDEYYTTADIRKF
jgi:hypothetical protein